MKPVAGALSGTVSGSRLRKTFQSAADKMAKVPEAKAEPALGLSETASPYPKNKHSAQNAQNRFRISSSDRSPRFTISSTFWACAKAAFHSSLLIFPSLLSRLQTVVDLSVLYPRRAKALRVICFPVSADLPAGALCFAGGDAVAVADTGRNTFTLSGEFSDLQIWKEMVQYIQTMKGGLLIWFFALVPNVELN